MNERVRKMNEIVFKVCIEQSTGCFHISYRLHYLLASCLLQSRQLNLSVCCYSRPLICEMLLLPKPGIFLALFAGLIELEGLPDWQCPLNLYANCLGALEIIEREQSKPGDFSHWSEHFWALKIENALWRKVHASYPGLADSPTFTHIDTWIRGLWDSEGFIIRVPLESFQDQSYKNFLKWMWRATILSISIASSSFPL